MSFYAVGKVIARFIGFQTIRCVVLHSDRVEGPGGFVLACSHLSHLEPFIVGAVMTRRVDFMARIEFYRNRLFARMLDILDAFPVNRTGVPVKAIRTSIARVRAGKIVGIFPEGGVVQGKESVLRGGPIKKGACVVAYRAAAPVVPVVVVGTEKLNRVGPWLPFRRARLWMIFGNPVHPHLNEPRRRVARDRMAIELQAEFQAIYQELCTTCGIDDKTVA